MSLEAAEKLLIRLKDDEKFRSRIVALDSTDDFLKTVREEGFNCTMEELEMVPMELGYDDLEQVSAGKGKYIYGPGGPGGYDWEKIKDFFRNIFG